MSLTETTLLSLLWRRCGSAEDAGRLLEGTALELGLSRDDISSKALHAITLVRTGYPLEKVARALSWKEFEGFCANILRASGYRVTENIFLKRPRRQVDIFARSTSFALSVDCKHWKTSIGDSGLANCARQQLERSLALRRTIEIAQAPILSVILTMPNEQPRIVEGVAVVPLLSLRDFLNSIESLKNLMSPS